MEDIGEMLRAEVEGYDGLYADMIQLVPDFFGMLSSLAEDPRLPQQARVLVNAAIAYFVLPFDVVPETGLGPFGYLDDLYLCAHVTFQMLCQPDLHELLEEHWPKDQTLALVVGEVLAKCKEALPEEDRQQVLVFSGLCQP